MTVVNIPMSGLVISSGVILLIVLSCVAHTFFSRKKSLPKMLSVEQLQKKRDDAIRRQQKEYKAKIESAYLAARRKLEDEPEYCCAIYHKEVADRLAAEGFGVDNNLGSTSIPFRAWVPNDKPVKWGDINI